MSIQVKEPAPDQQSQFNQHKAPRAIWVRKPFAEQKVRFSVNHSCANPISLSDTGTRRAIKDKRCVLGLLARAINDNRVNYNRENSLAETVDTIILT